MKTIGHILPFPAVGGTEHATVRIARSIDGSRFRSVAFRLPEADTVGAFLREAGVPCSVYEPPVPSYRHAGPYLRKSLALARELRRQRVDLVHCADLLAAYHAGLAGWLARIPVVCHIRNRFTTMSRYDCSFLWPVARFVFVSRNTWQHFGYRVPDARGEVVYDGIDLSGGSDPAEDRANVRRELGIPHDAPLIGMMARVAPQKDYPTLAKAAARVLGEEPDARFLVAGDYSAEANRQHYARVQTLLEENGVSRAFLFTGQRPDVTRLLRALDVFVLSTHWEGLPLVILEAMSQGTPVIATAVDGIPEIVQHEETGLLCGHEDDGQLAGAIVDLLRNRGKAERLGGNGRRLVQARFTMEKFAAGMNQVYSRVLDA